MPTIQQVSHPGSDLRERPPGLRQSVMELQGVSRSFGSQNVLRDVSLEVRRGETLVLIGESGCGKSVTTKLLAGLLEPTSGTVEWDGRPVGSRNVKEKRRDRLRRGYLFQGAALFDSMNVFDNIAFGLRENTTLAEPQIADIVIERLREVGLNETVGQKRPGDLSGGMKKRVGLARAIASEPDIIFFDEPTTGLDPIMADVINDLIVKCVKELGATTISITHDMHSARKIGDHLAMLYKGKLIWQGETKMIDASDNPYLTQFIHGRAEGPIKMEVRR
jgi:phospholipid/cholesterol/gamma-HCH transport system ATP-binding protein